MQETASNREFSQSVTKLVEPENFVEDNEILPLQIQELLKQGRLIDKLKANLELVPQEKEDIIEQLESRAWFRIFNLQAKDRLAYFMPPAGDFSIKNLNDNLLGPQLTDLLLHGRNEILRKLLEENGLGQLLHQDYKSAVYKIEPAEDQKNQEELTSVCEQLNEQVKTLLAIGDESLIELKKKELILDMSLDSLALSGKIEALNTFQHKVLKYGWQMNFGLSTVKESGVNNFTGQVLALTEAAQAAQLIRHGKWEKKGLNFNEQVVLSEIGSINVLREDIINGSPVLEDSNGISYQIFSQAKDKVVINRDLLRAVRKSEIAPGLGFENVFNKVTEYIRRINLLDVVKPFTASEVAGEKKLQQGKQTLAEAVNGTKQLINALKSEQLEDTQRQQLIKVLETDPKDQNCTSAVKFHNQARKIKDCVYVTIDVLDVGVELLLEYEKLLQEISSGEKSLAQASLLAGDQMTEYLREDIRQKALKICQKHLAKQSNVGPEILTLVGGDELVLALPDYPEIDKLLWDLQQETKGRIITTAVGTAERHNHEKSEKEIFHAHMAALKRSEIGTEIAKKIERKKRKVELQLNQNLNDEGYSQSEIRRIVTRVFGQLNLDNFYVKELAFGKFVIVAENDRELSYQDFIKQIEEIVIEYST